LAGDISRWSVHPRFAGTSLALERISPRSLDTAKLIRFALET
jgi:hypothetical protein